MPFDERAAAIASCEQYFADAIKAACNTLDTLLSGGDAPEAVELGRVRRALSRARRVRADMLKLIDEEWPPP